MIKLLGIILVLSVAAKKLTLKTILNLNPNQLTCDNQELIDQTILHTLDWIEIIDNKMLIERDLKILKQIETILQEPQELLQKYSSSFLQLNSNFDGNLADIAKLIDIYEKSNEHDKQLVLIKLTNMVKQNLIKYNYYYGEILHVKDSQYLSTKLKDFMKLKRNCETETQPLKDYKEVIRLENQKRQTQDVRHESQQIVNQNQNHKIKRKVHSPVQHIQNKEDIEVDEIGQEQPKKEQVYEEGSEEINQEDPRLQEKGYSQSQNPQNNQQYEYDNQRNQQYGEYDYNYNPNEQQNQISQQDQYNKQNQEQEQYAKQPYDYSDEQKEHLQQQQNYRSQSHEQNYNEGQQYQHQVVSQQQKNQQDQNQYNNQNQQVINSNEGQQYQHQVSQQQENYQDQNQYMKQNNYQNQQVINSNEGQQYQHQVSQQQENYQDQNQYMKQNNYQNQQVIKSNEGQQYQHQVSQQQENYQDQNQYMKQNNYQNQQVIKSNEGQQYQHQVSQQQENYQDQNQYINQNEYQKQQDFNSRQVGQTNQQQAHVTQQQNQGVYNEDQYLKNPETIIDQNTNQNGWDNNQVHQDRSQEHHEGNQLNRQQNQQMENKNNEVVWTLHDKNQAQNKDDEKKRSYKLVSQKPPDTLIDPTKFVPYQYKSPQVPVSVEQKPIKFLDSTYDSQSAFDKVYNDRFLQDSDEYGYGYWFKLQPQSIAPKRLYNDYYFLSRLTSNQECLDFLNYGDRTLTNWIYNNAIVFATYDYGKRQKNIYQPITINEDINGRWYFISFSYSAKQQLAVGFVLMYNRSNKKISIPSIHVPPFYFRMRVGGRNFHYLGIDGQFANVFVSFDNPSLVETEEQLFRLIDKVSFPPQIFKSYQEHQMVGLPKYFDANEKQQLEIELKDAQILQQYAVAGWVRWIDNLYVKETNSFQIINLKSNKQKSPNSGKLGDRELELHYIYGGGIQNTGIHYHTYTSEGNNGQGIPILAKEVKSSQFLWTYIYFGYNGDIKQAYGVFIKPGQNEEINFENIVHFHSSKLYVTIGGDQFVPSFNGRISHFGAFLGPDSYQPKKDFQYRFNYGEGAVFIFQLVKPLIFRAKNEYYEVAYDQIDPVINEIIIHSEETYKFNGQSEYSIGLWTYFLKSYPKYIQKRAPSYEIVAMGTQAKPIEILNEKLRQVDLTDYPTLKETTLKIMLGVQEYEFYAYNILKHEIARQGIPFNNQLEGFWNYLYFGYKRLGQDQGIAKAYIQFGLNGDIKEAQTNVYHMYLVNYVEFLMKKTNIPLFNGIVAGIQLLIGPQSFFETKEIYINWQTSQKLPEKVLSIQKQRESITLLGQVRDLNTLTDNDLIKEFPDHFGAQQYALSGWVRWTDKQNSGLLTNVVTMIQKKYREIIQVDTQLHIRRSDQMYFYGTYTCKDEDCTNQQERSIQFDEYWNQWAYLYIGYNRNQQKVFGYAQFPFKKVPIPIDQINRFYLSAFTIFLGSRVGEYKPFKGQYKTWILNIGDGSYKEGNYDQGEQLKMNFGFDTGSDHVKQTQVAKELANENKIIDSAYNDNLVPLNLEFKQSENLHLTGVYSYGFGLWSRFRFYGKATLYQQPKWMAIARLTINKNFLDYDQSGDRVLSILQGIDNYQFATYNLNQPNVEGSLKYFTNWESEWVYIYYSYGRQSETSGKAVGFVSRNEIINKLVQNVLHYPLNDYLLFMVGNSGKNYPNFNGQISGIKFRLGQGSFIDEETDIKSRMINVDPQPIITYDANHKYSVLDGKIENADKEFTQFVDFQTKEYCVILWYKLPEVTIDRKQVIYRLTSNPRDQMTDANKIGDKVLMFSKTQKKEMEFSTYTLPMTENQGQGQFIYDVFYQTPLPKEASYVWTFAYFGYSKTKQSVFYQLSAPGLDKKETQKILHAIGNRLWLYVVSDNILSRFEGGLAQISINIGPGAYTDTQVLFLPEYLAATNLFPKAKKAAWQNNDKIEISADGDDMSSTLRMDFFNGFQYQIESATEYSYGFWTRYLTTFPNRQYKKAPIMSLARLSINKEFTQGQVKIGDRVLATHIVFQSYQMSTYDLNQDQSIQVKSLPYNVLEGAWRYIYMGYKREKQIVQCYTYDTQINQVQITNILHRPLSDYLGFRLGKEQGLQSFQGQITKIQVIIGPGSYIETQDEFKKQIETTLTLPQEYVNDVDKQNHGKYEIIVDIQTVDDNFGGVETKGTKWAGVSEYSISGWFKIAITGDIENDCQVLYRLTNNQPPFLSDRKSQGDRTLYGSYCSGHLMRFSTYTLVNLENFDDVKILEQGLDLDSMRAVWTFVYMGYNQRTMEAHSLIHSIIDDKFIEFTQVLHLVPNYLSLTIGFDGIGKRFKGQLQHWTTQYGYGAFISIKKSNYKDLLPNYYFIKTDQKYQWSTEKDSIIESPAKIEKEFFNEVEQITEYAFGVWTRWLTDFPNKIVERKDSYQIFRLTSQRLNGDRSQYGDRVLTSYLLKKSYQFSTYSVKDKNYAVNGAAQYEVLEGNWVYIYASYKAGQFLGYVIFRDPPKAERIEMDVSHFPLSGYAKLVIGVSEFGHSAFHGWLYDPRLFLGQGAFIASSQQLVEMIQKIHRRLPTPNQNLEDFRWPIQQLDTTIPEYVRNIDIQYTFSNRQEAQEYSICLWVQGAVLLPDMQDYERILFRFSTNNPTVQKDYDIAGDRTLMATGNTEQITFSTYQLQDPPEFQKQQKNFKIQKYQWTYIYFGYMKGQSLAYLLQVAGIQKGNIPALHIIPNSFYLYIVKDATIPRFYGKITNLKVYFGPSSYFEDPRVTIEKWPFDQKYLPQADQTKEQKPGTEPVNVPPVPQAPKTTQAPQAPQVPKVPQVPPQPVVAKDVPKK